MSCCLMRMEFKKKDLKLVNHLINGLVAFKCRKVAFLGGTD